MVRNRFRRFAEVPGSTDLTAILNRAGRGDDSAINRVLPLVYDELRALAQHLLQHERPDHTLQATALVHEAYLRLVRHDDVEWRGRGHFFAAAAQAIRRILVDHARARRAAKRGAGAGCVHLTGDTPMPEDAGPDLVALDEALERLALQHPRQAQIVSMRFFGGFTLQEIAEYLDVSPRSVDGDWSVARAWLRRELGGSVG